MMSYQNKKFLLVMVVNCLVLSLMKLHTPWIWSISKIGLTETIMLLLTNPNYRKHHMALHMNMEVLCITVEVSIRHKKSSGDSAGASGAKSILNE
uniref:Secreted protein n=1 Tax=Acrobeloides nanus TaxID=290746 RepID=A0A914BYK1_9BILA